jgi:hypothetical protein
MSLEPFWMRQWALVMDAPLPFAACVIAAIGVIWLLVNWGYSRQIDALKQQVAAADQNMKLFKDQIPLLNSQIHDVQRAVERHDPYSAIQDTAANAVLTAAALSRVQSDFLIPVRNRRQKKVGN